MFRTIFTMITIVVMTILVGIGCIIVGPIFGHYSGAINWLGRVWSRSLLFAAGAKVVIEGMENIEPGASYVFVGNHQSHFDVPALFSIVRQNTLRFFAKKELFSIPLFGWAMQAAGMIKIDRSNREKAISSMNRAVDVVQHGVSLVVFAEGTRSAHGNLQKFKKGGFVIATRSHIPIMPFSVSGSRRILKKHTLRIEPGVIKIVFDKPLNTAGYTYATKEELMEVTRGVIEKNIDREIEKDLD